MVRKSASSAWSTRNRAPPVILPAGSFFQLVRADEICMVLPWMLPWAVFGAFRFVDDPI
jgi:hypothetical protein